MLGEKMARRKKKIKEALESQKLEKENAETPSSVSGRRKRKLEDAFIVISDSDGEEPKEENGLQNVETKQSNRANCLAKRKIAQMTEEEQFALALKMSEQEAREVNFKEEEEEELLRKAIAESLNSSQGLFVEETSEEKTAAPVPQSTAALTSKKSIVLMPESSAEEITVCPETQPSSPETLNFEREAFPSRRETLDEVRTMRDKEVDNRDNAKKKTPTPAFTSNNQVSCPLCDRSFPRSKIEQHAMYCNGLVDEDKVLTRRQKEARKKSSSGTAMQTSLDNDKNEKCYVCQSLVPFKEYQSHVDSCLQLAMGDQRDRSEKSARAHSPVEGKQQPQLRNPKEKGQNEGRLLSLLEQSEHKTADAEMNTKSSETGTFRSSSLGVEEAACSGKLQSSLSQLGFSESPIKSFVAISETTDCLVDFKNQLTVQPGSRTRAKAGRGKRRKT
ncbi:BRCA1-A complex subunit RAP80 isoform X6 [Perognathus longimembris pacificus]|uniref:BRCA1-A complex subunit RAP80 isoform X6 n=1 Tax=Perognathus longimembris pacificus TaxID=214514 RepID=UPI0020190E1F|nr:BRCA1-A complex subunit RAP80 isoform X6 [Perognathus longimembris pacificus]